MVIRRWQTGVITLGPVEYMHPREANGPQYGDQRALPLGQRLVDHIPNGKEHCDEARDEEPVDEGVHGHVDLKHDGVVEVAAVIRVQEEEVTVVPHLVHFAVEAADAGDILLAGN